MSDLFKAMKLESNGHFQTASKMYQELGNKERPVSEKEALYAKSAQCRRIHESD